MTQNSSFRDWLCREIREVLSRQNGIPPLMIWCDPDGSWLDLLRECAQADGFNLLAPVDGHEGDHELIVRDRFYTAERSPCIVWLPCDRDSISWFKPFELEAEEVWEKNLLTALREYGVEISREHEDDLVGLLPAHAREWLDKPKATWKELTPGNAKGALIGNERMLQILAGSAGEFDRLREEDRFDIFVRRAVEDFGLPDPTGADETEWRVAATACLLCTDAAAGNPQDPPAEPERIIGTGLPRKNSLDLLRDWQYDIRYIPSYETLVPRAEATIGLTYWARNLSALPRSRSSRAVEEAMFSQIVDRLDRFEDVDALIDELERGIQTWKDREHGFWGREATQKVGWRFLVELADVASLLVENKATESHWTALTDATDWYSDVGWKLDWAGEQLFKEQPDLPSGLNGIRSRLRRGYLRTMDRVGRAFSKFLEKDSDKLNALPSAGEVLLAELEKQSTPTAIVFLDACRLDIGHRLRDLLNQGEPAQRASVSVSVAPVPSITAIGMAFALPIKRDELRVEVSGDGKFSVYANGFTGDLKWAEQRRNWLKEKFDIKDWLEMADVFEDGKLKKPTKARRMVAVHGKELDAHDGELELTGADEHVRRYVQAIRRLRDAGYTRVIVVTDHGFFHWQPDEHDIDEQCPDGDVLWKSRRAVVGRNLSHATAIKLPLQRSDLEVMVPRSTNAFRTYGKLGFFHGGASLQETIIPVVVATWPTKAEKVRVILKPIEHITSIMPRIEVAAGATGKTKGLFGPDSSQLARDVVVRVRDPATGHVVFRHDSSVTIEPEGQNESITLKVVESPPALSFGSVLSVEVRDADNDEVLDTAEVSLRTEIGDEDWF
jgi:hypothetical protein